MHRAIKRYGLRRLLLRATTLTGLIFTSYALFSPTTSHLLMFGTVFVGGLFSSLCLISLNTLGFVDVPKQRISHATALLSMAQQLLAGVGVVLAAALLASFSWWHDGDGAHLVQQDFSAAIVVMGLLSLLSLLPFERLNPQETDKLS
jgi:MFS family permease